ncbi:hypothetical protein BDV93DRAFT_529905 [Ceratobasidium sp. AG-I]|nr:hypothetical protein BDV93DRAFT_529905 [Ceratobasidium sp. AG-I]
MVCLRPFFLFVYLLLLSSHLCPFGVQPALTFALTHRSLLQMLDPLSLAVPDRSLQPIAPVYSPRCYDRSPVHRVLDCVSPATPQHSDPPLVLATNTSRTSGSALARATGPIQVSLLYIRAPTRAPVAPLGHKYLGPTEPHSHERYVL